MLQVQMTVGADPAEVGRARRWARARLLGSGIRGDEPLAETLMLLISELVTNAVVHTGRPAVLRMVLPAPASHRTPAPAPAPAPVPAVLRAPDTVRPGALVPVAVRVGAGSPGGADRWGVCGTVRVEVADTSGFPPAPRRARGDETGGRGLELVERLADRWGWVREDGGKRIWCEVDRVAEEVASGGGEFGAPQGCAVADHG